MHICLALLLLLVRVGISDPLEILVLHKAVSKLVGKEEFCFPLQMDNEILKYVACAQIHRSSYAPGSGLLSPLLTHFQHNQLHNQWVLVLGLCRHVHWIFQENHCNQAL